MFLSPRQCPENLKTCSVYRRPRRKKKINNVEKKLSNAREGERYVRKLSITRNINAACAMKIILGIHFRIFEIPVKTREIFTIPRDQPNLI